MLCRPSLLLACSALLLLSVAVTAQRGGGNGGNNNAIASLKGVAIPQRPELARYVADRQSLLVLGKALFWDVRVGSDGRTACATCHFHAGADPRMRGLKCWSPRAVPWDLKPCV